MRPEDQDDYRDRAGRADRREAMPPILGQVVDLGHYPADDEKRHVYAFRALSGGFDRAEGGTIRLALVGEPLFAEDLTPPGAGAHPAVGDQHVLRWIGDRLAFSAGSIGGMLSLSVIATSYSISTTPNANPFRTDPPTNGFVTSKGDGSRFHIDLFIGIWWNPDFDPVDETSGPDREVADPSKWPPPFSDPKIYVPEDPFWSGAFEDVPPPPPLPIDPTTPPGFVPPPHDPGDTIAGGGIDVYPGRRCRVYFRLTDTADYYGYAYEQWGWIDFRNAGRQDEVIHFGMGRYNISAQDRLKWLCPPVHHARRDDSDRLQRYAGIAATATCTAQSLGNAQVYRVPGGEPIPVSWPVTAQTDTGEALDSEHPEDAIGTEGIMILRVPGVLGGVVTITTDGYVPDEVTLSTIVTNPFSGIPNITPVVPGLNPYPLLFCKDNMDGYTGTGDEPTFPPCFPRKLSLTFWKTAVSKAMGTTVNLARYPGCATADGGEWLGEYAGEEVTIEIHGRTADPLQPVSYQSPCRKDYKWGRRPTPFKSAHLIATFNPATGGSGEAHGFYYADDCTGGGEGFAWFQLNLPACKDNEDRPTTGPIYLFNTFYYFGSSAFVCYYYPNIFSTLPEPVAIYDMQIGVWSIEGDEGGGEGTDPPPP